MKIIKGIYAEAKIFTDDVEDYAQAQVKMICDSETAEGSTICMMPDIHPCKIAPIGLSMTVTGKVVPQLLGVDIGCGMTCVKLNKNNVEFQKLDRVIRENIPSGFAIRREPHYMAEEFSCEGIRCIRHINRQKAERSLGTLGGGNHFIEIDQAADGTKYLVIHTGSRNLGKQVADLYQHLAVELHSGKEEYFKKRDEIIATYKAEGRRKEIQAALKELTWEKRDCFIPDDLCYLYGTYFDDYMHDVEVCQQFARRNREKIAEVLLSRIGAEAGESFHTIHNYIDTKNMILRKGAISAYKDEKILIPINMRDGSVLATGKGNPDWNYSAPHGAGRLMSRTKAKETLSMEEYKNVMKGIYTTSVNEATLDEAPMAYKSLDDIIDAIKESVNIIDIMKPVYNFKAS